MRHKVTIAAIQMKMSTDPAGNLAKSERMIRLAAQKGAQIIFLPELCRTIYFPQYEGTERTEGTDFAESIPGESTRHFGSLARELETVIIVPLYEKSKAGKFYNTAAVLNHDGKLLPLYRKLHIPQDPLFYEKNYFSPGDSGYRVYKTKFATFAVLICYDQWFPEAARMAALGGAEIIFYPTAIGHIVGHKSKDGDWHDAWETVMRGHAIANGIHVAAVNRTGREDRLRFWGQSFVCDSFGKVLRRASADREEVFIQQLDLSHNQRIREGWGFFRNRRPDTYKFKASK